MVLPRTGAAFHFTKGGDIPCRHGEQHFALPRKSWHLLPQRHHAALPRELLSCCATNTRASALAEPARENEAQASELPRALVIMREGPHVREPMYYHGGVFDVAITGVTFVTFAVSSGVARFSSIHLHFPPRFRIRFSF